MEARRPGAFRRRKKSKRGKAWQAIRTAGSFILGFIDQSFVTSTRHIRHEHNTKNIIKATCIPPLVASLQTPSCFLPPSNHRLPPPHGQRANVRPRRPITPDQPAHQWRRISPAHQWRYLLPLQPPPRPGRTKFITLATTKAQAYNCRNILCCRSMRSGVTGACHISPQGTHERIPWCCIIALSRSFPSLPFSRQELEMWGGIFCIFLFS